MEFKLLVLLSVAGTGCAASIQNPFIHDSVEDQIAMESGLRRSVVAAPAHLTQDTSSTTSAPPPTEAAATDKPEVIVIEDVLELAEPEPEPENELHRPAVQASQFSILSQGKPLLLPAIQPRPRPQFPSFGQSLGALSLQRPMMQQQMPEMFFSPYQYRPMAGFGGGYGGGYGNTIIMLQPIYVPVPIRVGDGDDESFGSVQSQLQSYFHRQMARRPTLSDILQQSFYKF